LRQVHNPVACFAFFASRLSFRAEPLPAHAANLDSPGGVEESQTKPLATIEILRFAQDDKEEDADFAFFAVFADFADLGSAVLGSKMRSRK